MRLKIGFGDKQKRIVFGEHVAKVQKGANPSL